MGISDDKMTEIKRTRAYLGENAGIHYREFVENLGHKYVVQENEIKKIWEKMIYGYRGKKLCDTGDRWISSRY